MTGWEATAQAGQGNTTAYPLYRDNLLDQAVNDGINRLRVEVVNTTGTTSMDFVSFDDTIDKVVIPMRQKMQARGEQPGATFH
jgi:hypothetical protein